MIRVAYTAQKPDDITFTLQLTATAKEFRELSEQLSEKWPSWQLAAAINSVLRTARNVFEAEQQV